MTTPEIATATAVVRVRGKVPICFVYHLIFPSGTLTTFYRDLEHHREFTNITPVSIKRLVRAVLASERQPGNRTSACQLGWFHYPTPRARAQ